MIGRGGWVSTVVTAGEPCADPRPTSDVSCTPMRIATFGQPRAIAAGPEGVLYLSDLAGHQVWRLVPRP
jgi:hypothetical protein